MEVPVLLWLSFCFVVNALFCSRGSSSAAATRCCISFASALLRRAVDLLSPAASDNEEDDRDAVADDAADEDVDDEVVVRIMFSDAFFAALRCGTTSRSVGGKAAFDIDDDDVVC